MRFSNSLIGIGPENRHDGIEGLTVPVTRPKGSDNQFLSAMSRSSPIPALSMRGSAAASFSVVILIACGSLERARSSQVFGDFDGNGFDDLAIGCPSQTITDGDTNLSRAGAVTVIYAGANGLGVRSELWHLNSPEINVGASAFDGFGAALVVGDFDGDGIDDLAAGSPSIDEAGGAKDIGAVTILFGSLSDGLTRGSLLGSKHIHRRSLGDTPRSDDRFGRALAVGDFDHDGSDDLAIGVPGAGILMESSPFVGDLGMAYVLYGPLIDRHDGAIVSRVQTWSQQDGPGELEGRGNAETGDRFGSALATGDFDGDEFDDLAVGVTGEGVGLFTAFGAGAVNIVYGSTSGLQEARSDVFTQNTDGVKGESDRSDNFGHALAVGNFNGDVNPSTGCPIDDLAVGVPSEDFQDDSFDFVGNADRGIVQVLYGSPNGLSTVDQIWSDESPGLPDESDAHERFGFAVVAGNFNGDRHPITNVPLDDLAIGVPGESLFDGSETRESAGQVIVLFGSEDRLTADGSYRLNQFGIGDGPQDDDFFGIRLAVGHAGGSNSPELAVGVIDGPYGAAHVFYGTGSGPRVAGNEVFLCLEEDPGRPLIPGAIPGGPGEGVFHFVSPVRIADSSDASESAPFYSTSQDYLFQFEGSGLEDGWSHDSEADAWDGVGISKFNSSPGGAEYRELDGDTFVRVQDTGDPRDHGFAGETSNQAITFSRDLRALFEGDDDRILDDGLTLHFRIRLSTAFNGPLDAVHPDGGGPVGAVPVTGDGLGSISAGFGHIQVHQGTGPQQGNIGFSLAVPAEIDPDSDGSLGRSGLIMNSLNGTSPTLAVDLDQGIRNNIHPVEDPTRWQEFWITIERNTQFFSTHRLQVYHNGSTWPQIYFVTAANCNCDAPGGAGLALSAGFIHTSSAIDVDFVRVVNGIVPPVTRPVDQLEIDLTVPGTANPWLAGMPDGWMSGSIDVAPTHSPVEVPGVPIVPGKSLTFRASGGVNHSGEAPLVPDGGSPWTRGGENGISGAVLIPLDALVGVFLGPDQPNLSAAPAALNFGTFESRDYLTLSPLLKQVFFIGDGLTSDGRRQQVIVPSGATRLFLGSMDGSGWYNNSGSFSVKMPAVFDGGATVVNVVYVNPAPPAGPLSLGLEEFPEEIPARFLINGTPSPGLNTFTRNDVLFAELRIGDGTWTTRDLQSFTIEIFADDDGEEEPCPNVTNLTYEFGSITTASAVMDPVLNNSFQLHVSGTDLASGQDFEYLHQGSAQEVIVVNGTGVGQLVITSVSFVPGRISLSGSGGTSEAEFQVLSSTDLAVSLANWSVLSTHTFDGNGSFDVIIPVVPNEPERYYRVLQP